MARMIEKMKIAALAFLWMLISTAFGCAAEQETQSPRLEPVRVVHLDNGSWELKVGDKPYFVKGILFTPVKIGESPKDSAMRDWMSYDDNHDGINDVAFQTWVDENKNNRRDPSEKIEGDFEFLRRVGCNTIRLYHLPSDNPILGNIYKTDPSTQLQFDHPVNKPLLRRLYNDYGIRIIMGNFLGSWTIGSGASWEEGTDYTNPVHRENIKKSVKAMILDNKDEPYVLLWILGNENNIASWSHCNAKTQPEAYATLVGEIAQMVHELDPNHPVAVCDGDPGNANNLSFYAKHAPGIDIVCFNSYRGPFGFDFLWKQARKAFDRPVLITEFGIFAYNQPAGEDQDQQLMYLKGCWKDIVQQSAAYFGLGKKREGNSIGGIVFDWVDRWYMDGTPSEHNAGTRYWDSSPDHLDHEEWFGLVSMGDGSDTLMRQKRKSYGYLEEVWNRSDLSF